ncbi:MAG: YcbK family protein [Methylococcales bacterium]|nr:YcbK family protein [Methylococcales bacterium]
MQSPITENLAIDDNKALSSRRKFLTHLAGGSLLFIAGTSIASAGSRAKHFSVRKTAAKNSVKVTHVSANKHTEKTKNTLSHRLAKKSDHRIHQQLTAHNSHSKLFRQHSKHGRIQVTSHSPRRSRMYRDDAIALDTYEERQYFSQKIPSKMIALQNPHTGDKLRLTYFERGLYIEDALEEIDYVLRDYHTGDIHPIDPSLLDQLYELKLRLGVSRPFNIISAYRSPETNANLRRHSDGVARNSLHMQGRAVDIRLDGMSARHIRDAALSMGRGGVGYYSASNFVHIDTGDVRTWGA